MKWWPLAIQGRAHQQLYVTVVARTMAGINKTDCRHDERADQVRRCVTAEPLPVLVNSRIAWLDPPGDLVQRNIGNISFEATRPEREQMIATQICTSDRVAIRRSLGRFGHGSLRRGPAGGRLLCPQVGLAGGVDRK